MPSVPLSFNWGEDLYEFNDELVRQLDRAYNTTSSVINTKTSKVATNGDTIAHATPPASSSFNKSFDIGDIYVRTDNDTAWLMTSRTTDIAVTWTQFI